MHFETYYYNNNSSASTAQHHRKVVYILSVPGQVWINQSQLNLKGGIQKLLVNAAIYKRNPKAVHFTHVRHSFNTWVR